MTEPTINFEQRGAIGIITLNRPEQRNAITAQMVAELREIRASVGWDSGIRVFVLAACGADFSAGTDPDSLQQFTQREEQIRHHTVAAHIASLPQPVVAAINGAAFGQGLELALACDIRIAAHGAHFSMTQISGDDMPFDGGTQRLPRVVGRMKALEMILCGAVIDAQEAKEIGLVNRLVPQEALLPEALKLAEDLAAKAPLAMKYAKEAVMKGMDMTLSQGLRLEADLYFLLHTTGDRREGIEAFREKRPPKFREK
ncbi:MAG: enoyl-CoA hydratase/isomerase family protein [Deltaproteobacteria bacterium]|nr:enoyl-CoA hydratase/isomerase family protein [Deltaproteobacteria bacterium]